KNGGTGGTGGSAADDPKAVRTETVAEPAHDLAISVLDSGGAILDKTPGRLTTIRGDVTKKIPLPMSGPGPMPARPNGGDLPGPAVDDNSVYVVTGDKVSQFTVPSDGGTLKPCVAWAKRFYCTVEATGTVYVLDEAAHLANTVKVPDTGGGPLDLEVREDHLFINAPTTSKAE